MNIQDAIKSGKPFNPISDKSVSIVYNSFTGKFYHEECGTIYFYDLKDMIFWEFELKQEPRKVTLYQYLYEYSGKKMLMSLETNETWDQYNCDRDDCKLLKTFTREIEL